MEHQFNPVESPKQESIEKNETETGDEAQAQSTSLQVKQKPTESVKS